MTALHTLFNCAAADITIEHVQALVAETGPESTTVEYKVAQVGRVVECVAAFANTYGGIILLGVDDETHAIKGVPGEMVTHVGNGCNANLTPRFTPEIIPVAIDNEPGKYVIVIRVDADQADRPIYKGDVAPVRFPGSCGKADRSRLAALFAEAPTPTLSGQLAAKIPRFPNLAGPADLMLRSGFTFPLQGPAQRRPFSHQALDDLTAALNDSALVAELGLWMARLHIANLDRFKRRNFNRARYARLTWHAIPDHDVVRPLRVEVNLKPPGQNLGPSESLEFTVDIAVCVDASHRGGPERLEPADVHRLLDALMETLTSPNLVTPLADLAGIDPALMPSPPQTYLTVEGSTAEVLAPNGLKAIPDAGVSRGTDLLTDPDWNLGDPGDRARQVDVWLDQFALDAGLLGMPAVIAHLRAANRLRGAD